MSFMTALQFYKEGTENIGNDWLICRKSMPSKARLEGNPLYFKINADKLEKRKTPKITISTVNFKDSRTSSANVDAADDDVTDTHLL